MPFISKPETTQIIKENEDKTPEPDLNEKDLSDLSYKEFEIIVVKMLTEVKRTMHEQSENFNKERRYKKIQS